MLHQTQSLAESIRSMHAGCKFIVMAGQQPWSRNPNAVHGRFMQKCTGRPLNTLLQLPCYASHSRQTSTISWQTHTSDP